MLKDPEARYEVQYEKSAEKFFVKHEDIRLQYIQNLSAWLNGVNPERVDVKTIKGKRNKYYRMRVGDWRVIFSIINGKIVVINTILAGSRGDIYKKIGGLS